MAMESTLFGVAIKGDRSLRELKDKTSSLATCYDFLVPADGLRVGTLDLLMSLSDDLAKMDSLSEATCWKIYRQLAELKPDKKPTIDGGAQSPRPRPQDPYPHPRPSQRRRYAQPRG